MVERSMKGLFPVMSMPFDAQGRIDVEDLQREVEYTIEVAGVDGLAVAFASEISKLSEAERDLVTKTVVDQAEGRVPVVINTGAQGTDVAVQYSRRAEELGADAVMLLPPPEVTGGELGREYFGRVARVVAVPVFIQDAGPAFSPAEAARIARDNPNVCYAKVESSPPPLRIAEWAEATEGSMKIFGGASGAYVIEELRRGSVGTMPHCAFIEMFRRVLDLFNNGQKDHAEQEFNRHSPLFRTSVSALYMTKEILRRKGVFKAVHLRHPAAPQDEYSVKEFHRLVEVLGLANRTPTEPCHARGEYSVDTVGMQ